MSDAIEAVAKGFALYWGIYAYSQNWPTWALVAFISVMYPNLFHRGPKDGADGSH